MLGDGDEGRDGRVVGRCGSEEAEGECAKVAGDGWCGGRVASVAANHASTLSRALAMPPSSCTLAQPKREAGTPAASSL